MVLCADKYAANTGPRQQPGRHQSGTWLTWKTRVRVFGGRPQLYGTQFMYDKDELKPLPIEDPENLDQRRAAVGLGPFAEHEAQMHRRH